MQFTKDSIRWCGGDETLTKLKDVHLSWKLLPKVLLYKVHQGVQNRLNIAVCFASYEHVPSQYGIVMGDVHYYQKLLSGTCTNGLGVWFAFVLIIQLIVIYFKYSSIVSILLCGFGSSKITVYVQTHQLLHITVHKLLSWLCLSIKK